MTRATRLAIVLATALAALGIPRVVVWWRSADLVIPYGADALQVAQVYLSESGATPAKGIILIHGGAWQDGDAQDVAEIARWLAVEGVTAIAINYRLTPSGAAWPEIRSDIEAAFRLIRGKADELKIDRQHIGVYGESAGGHLAAWLATQGAGEGDGPSCLLTFGAPWDLTSRTAIKDWILPAVDRLIPPEHAAEASPALLENRRPVPPSFLVHNRDDIIVPISQLETAVDWIKAHGGEAEVRIFDGLGHGEWPTGSAMDQLKADMLRFISDEC